MTIFFLGFIKFISILELFLIYKISPPLVGSSQVVKILISSLDLFKIACYLICLRSWRNSLSSNKYLWNVHCVLGTGLDVGEMGMVLSQGVYSRR